MYKIKKNVIDEIISGDYSCTQVKIWLWWCTIFPESFRPCLRDVPSEMKAGKISKKMNITIDQFYRAFRSLIIFPKDEIESIKEIPLTPADVFQALGDSDEREIIQPFIDNGETISLSDKLDIARIKTRYPNIKDMVKLWFNYQDEFKNVTTVEKRAAYLFGTKYRNFTHNLDKFKDIETFKAVMEEHKMRLITLRKTPISYGYAKDPIEDKQMAMEKERENICFALQAKKEYGQAIIFKENIEYYEKKVKRIRKKNEVKQ
jgi:hypothetical protein